LIVLSKVTLRRGTKVLLDKTTVTINPGEKVGLVGRNGAGKSTLFEGRPGIVRKPRKNNLADCSERKNEARAGFHRPALLN
jgi:ATPase subunit of ABC transporter with duplicated ATPase domains